MRSRAAFYSLALAGSALASEVRGRAIVDDGIPPAEPIRVELHCPGAETVTGAADPDGRFALPMPATDGCRITATLSGYTSATVPVDRLPLDPEIAGVELRREGKWQGYTLSRTTLAALPAAQVSFSEGVRTLRGGGQANMSKAELLFARAVEQDPQFAEAWFQLARLRLARADVAAARVALRSALAADSWFLSPYRPLLMLELGEERWSEARELCRQWLDSSPGVTDALLYGALSSLEMNDLAAAKEGLGAIEAGPDGASFAAVHYLRGRILEREGHPAEAGAEYREYLSAGAEGPLAEEARARLAKAGSR
ncbi:MAG: hypothetical protein R2762_30955 [Bryobacteraceae bacterium]